MDTKDQLPATKADLEAVLEKFLQRVARQFDASVLDATTKLTQTLDEYRRSNLRFSSMQSIPASPDAFTNLRIERLEDAVKQLRARVAELEKRL